MKTYNSSRPSQKNNTIIFGNYGIKRLCISNLLDAMNQGNEKASNLMLPILEDLTSSDNKNSGIAKTLLERCRKYNYVYYTEAQINGLAFMASELGYYIPPCPISNNIPKAKVSIRNCEEYDLPKNLVRTPKSRKWVTHPECVGRHDTVEFVDIDTGSLQRLKIVHVGCGDIRENSVSEDAPIAAALLDHVVGDIVKFRTNSGPRSIKITNISKRGLLANTEENAADVNNEIVIE